jgi:prolipoprotein diacylglyceryl transferase
MNILSYITWDVSPLLFELGPLAVRWYGLLFAFAFVFGYKVIEYVYKTEGLTAQDADKVAMYMVFGVVIGARLGHVFFYQPDYYLAHPAEILMIWEGGLASHGASIGVILAMYLYSRTKEISPKGFMWMLDRIILTIPVGGAFIRIGNLMNSEIYGKPTDVSWAFIYVRDVASGNLPRHPTQIYEAIAYFISFFILFNYYKKRKANVPKGGLFGLFLILIFQIIRLLRDTNIYVNYILIQILQNYKQ